MRPTAPQNPSEHAARDRQIAHAHATVADLIGFARATLRDGGDQADAFVEVGLRCADACVQCEPDEEQGFNIGLLTAAVMATARHLDAEPRS